MEYVVHILIMIGVYVALSVSLDLLVGHTGLLSLAHAAFYGLGAYTSAVMAVRFHLSFGAGLAVAIALAIVLSLSVSLPSLRLRDDSFVIATFAFQMIVVSILNNWSTVTRGPLGIAGVPAPRIFRWTLSSSSAFLILAAALVLVACTIGIQIVSSPFGRALRAVREDELFAMSLGKNTVRLKVTVVAVSAALAASAGSVYAHYVTYVDPSTFGIMESVLVLSMVIIGGTVASWGPVVGATFLVVLPEALRFLGLPETVAANIRQLLFGVLLVIVVMTRGGEKVSIRRVAR